MRGILYYLLPFAAMLAIMLVAPTALARQQEPADTTSVLYVSLTGTDAGDGSEANPFPSLEAARNHLRNAGVPEGGVTVYLREGVYRRSNIFVLTAKDSGTAESPVVYAAYPGEKVVLLGSQILDAGKLTPLQSLTDLPNSSVLERIPEAALPYVHVYNLTEDGIITGAIKPLGLGVQGEQAPEVFVNGRRASLARYPNEGYMHPDAVVDGHARSKNRKSPPVFRHADVRFAKWALEDDAWLHGYFLFDWDDEWHRIARMEQDAEEAGSTLLTTELQAKFGTSANRKDVKYYGYNILAELDSQSEYYIDRSGEQKYLYIYLDNPEESEVSVVTNQASVIDMRGVEHVTFRGLAIGEAMQHGVQMLDCNDCSIEACEVFRTGMYGVRIGSAQPVADPQKGWSGGRNNQVLRCEIHDTGMGGVICSGGDFISLEPSNNAVIGCTIHDFSQRVRTYTPAINMFGVGGIARGNTIYNGPHEAIEANGNNLLIERNEIYNVLTETGDAGVIYSGRSWVRRGNVIRYNYIHDIPNPSTTTNAIYLDDAMSGWTVHGNILHNIQDAASLYGGGRDITVYGNTYINVATGAYRIDDRTLNFTSPNNVNLAAEYDRAPIASDAWKAAYPELYATLGHMNLDIKTITMQPDEEKDRLNPVLPANINIRDEALVNTRIGSITLLARKLGDINTNPKKYAAPDEIIDAHLPQFVAVLLTEGSTEADIEQAKAAFLEKLKTKQQDYIAHGKPVVDGKKDAAYDASMRIPLDERFWFFGDESRKKEPGISGYYTLLWDQAYLYVYAEVHDEEILTAGHHYVTHPRNNNPWQTDAVELFVNGHKISVDAFGIRTFTEHNKFTEEFLAAIPKATVFLKDGEVVGSGDAYSPEQLVRGFRAEGADAYAVEFAVPLEAILGRAPKADVDALEVKVQINAAVSFDAGGPHMWITDQPTTMNLVLRAPKD